MDENSHCGIFSPGRLRPSAHGKIASSQSAGFGLGLKKKPGGIPKGDSGLGKYSEAIGFEYQAPGGEN